MRPSPAVLTLMCWNVLADAYVRPKYFPSSPRALLRAGARTDAITERLAGADADVVCLQEAEAPLIEAVARRLEKHTPRVLMKPGKPDGCATFVRGFAIVATHEIAYADAAPPSGHGALLLEIDVLGARLGIANTHLKWDAPNATDRYAPKQIAELVGAMRADIPWLVCGDFNIAPDDPANAAFAVAGFVDAYAGTAHEGPTVVTNGRARRIDFIRTRGLEVEALPIATLTDGAILPSESEPSDHIPIAVRARR